MRCLQRRRAGLLATSCEAGVAHGWKIACAILAVCVQEVTCLLSHHSRPQQATPWSGLCDQAVGPLLPACGLPSHAVRLAPAEMQTQRVPGRKRGRPPLHSTRVQMAVHNLYSASAASVPAVTIPKKRGRKPRYKIKSPVLMTPLALSPPRSTPEPDLSSIPQDAATIPSLVVPEALTVCLYINKQADVGPYLERRKLQQLPERLGPERPATVLQQAVQACIDCAHQPRLVFSLVKQGYRGELVSAKVATAEECLANAVGMNRYAMDFSHRGSVTHSSSLYKRLTCGDSHLAGGPATTTSGSRTNPVPSGGSSSPGLRLPASSPKRNGTAIEGNRCAPSPSPEVQDTRRPSSRNPSTWTVEDVVRFVKDADPEALGPHVELFRKHEIDGNALLLLRSDMIMKYLGLKLGPALKLCYHIDKLKQAKF
ncbi:sex comb on midleg-like protein 4 isoform X2 [Mus musculus]|uniref:sex comb on midleg-like protein 4 isoform X2 n=1 Tax=Mus musculus TaxID=10090 RepID=UPI0003D75032|nr:sex comb on midleg-like protein 4 isoform X2 [Mus musculus]|eukprot:XP_006512815.1 PREDICTED: sex comb on midleg-like protein 4 isoform X3 [Mus musculus]